MTREPMLDLLDISKELGIRPERLRAAAFRGEFPRILRVTRTAYRVERSAYETWRAVNWLSPADLRSEHPPEFLARAMQLGIGVQDARPRVAVRPARRLFPARSGRPDEPLN